MGVEQTIIDLVTGNNRFNDVIQLLTLAIAFLGVVTSSFLAYLGLRQATASAESAAKSAMTAVDALEVQRDHNIRSVIPILQIIPTDHNEKLVVQVKNSGLGPLTITNSDVTGENGVKKKSIIEWMPTHPEYPAKNYWTTFRYGLNGTTLVPGETLDVILLEGDETAADFIAHRDEVRLSLSKLSISVAFTDVYGRHMPAQLVRLNWFARPLGVAKNVKQLAPEF